jgi:hypothetical protein
MSETEKACGIEVGDLIEFDNENDKAETGHKIGVVTKIHDEEWFTLTVLFGEIEWRCNAHHVVKL